MAEYLVASGSRKISNLTLISGISSSAVIPVVMGSTLSGIGAITDGTTNQITYQNFRRSVILESTASFTVPQTIQTGVPASTTSKVTTLNGNEIILQNGNSVIGDGIRISTSGSNEGVKLYTLDKADNMTFKTFLTIGTDYGDVTITRPLTASNDLNVLGDLEIGGALTIGQNLVVGGTITAQSYNSELISSSIIYESGSTKFGDDINDIHQRTGSLYISGSTFVAGDSSFAKNLGIGGNSIVAGNSTVNGVIINTLLSTVTSSLLTQSISQGLVNDLTLAVTSSLITIVGGLQGYTASLKGVAIVSSSNQLFELNNQTGSQDSVNNLTSAVTSSLINIVGGLQSYTASLKSVSIVSSSNQLFELNNQTGSQDSVNNLTSAVTASLIGIVGGLQGYTASLKGAAIVSSSNQLFELNNQTGSQDSVNNLTSAVTSSLIGIVGGLQAYTASLKGVAIVSSSNQLFELNNQTGSQDSVNTLTSAVTSSLITIVGGLQGYTASLKAVAIVSSSNQLFELNNQTGSQDSVNNLTQAVTASLIGIVGGLQSYTASLKNVGIVSSSNQLLELNNQTGSQNSINSGIATVTGSITNILTLLNIATASLNDYSQSLKAAAIVSSSQQIIDYNTFALTSSANVFFGKQSVSGALHVANGITGSFLGTLTGNATFASNTSNVALLKDNTDTTLYPIFSSTVAADTYSTLKGHASGTLYYNGLTQQLIVSGGGLVVNGSANITGSLNVTGSIVINSGSITMPNRPAFRVVGDGGQTIAPYTISGSRTVVDYNQGNHWNNTTGLFTAPIAGLYQVNLVIRTHSNTNSTINQAIVYKSGSNTAGDVAQIMVEYGVNTTMNHTGGSTISKLDVDDTLKVVVTVGTCSFDSNDNFSVAYIG